VCVCVWDGAGKKNKPVKTSAADERRTALRRARTRTRLVRIVVDRRSRFWRNPRGRV